MPKAKRKKLPFIGQGAIGRSEFVNSEELINLYPEIDKTSKAILSLHNCPGLDLELTLGAGPSRASLVHDVLCFWVSGDRFYRINQVLGAVLVGTINTNSGFVSLSTDGTYVLIIDAEGQQGWTYNISTEAFAQITDADFPTRPTVSAVVSGNFLVLDGTTQRVHYATDPTTWGALDFFSAESTPDDLVSIIGDHNEAVLLGTQSIETWRLGTSWGIVGQPLGYGCIAKGSVVAMDNSVFWLDKDGMVRSLRGGASPRVSTHAIEHRIAQHTKAEIAAAIALSSSPEGHSFYMLNVGDETLVYDAATQLWHRRAYLVPATGLLIQHRAICYARFAGKHLVGDYENGRIYNYDIGTYTDNGDQIQATFTYRHSEYRGLMIDYELVNVEVEPGVGTQTGQGIDPQIEVRYSEDGGKEWVPWRQADIGAVGKYKTRATMARLGRSDDWVLQCRITDPVKRTIANANLEVTIV